VKQHTRELKKPSIDDETALSIIEKLVNAKNPVAYVGGGVLLADAAAALKEFVEHFDIPVAHSLMGKGALPDNHPLTLGMTGFWGTKFINDTCRNADVLLALGTQFAEADSSSWESEYTFDIPKTKLIHIDINPEEIGRNYPAEIGVVADLKQALRVLNRVAKEHYPNGKNNDSLREQIATYRKEFKASNESVRTSDEFPLKPQRILADVEAVLPDNVYITTDVGWNKNGVGQQFPINQPGSILTPGGFATMGFGAPAAMGAKIADPSRTVISLVGDGGFGQNPAMLATAAEENIAVIWVIMNNFSYGTIAGLQKAHFDTTYGTIFEKDGAPYSPDYAAIAKAYGVEGIKINAADEFKRALEKAIKMNKPVVIDVPMINDPVPTDGHWNIMDIYSPGKKIHHVTVN